MSNYNNKLSIAVPTYNRAMILRGNILSMMPDLNKYQIPVFISDDSTNDETKVMIDELKLQYEHLYYQHNQPSLGHDKNFFTTVGIPDTEYVWYLGDSLFIKTGVIGDILSILDESIDMCFVNSYVEGDGVGRRIDDVHEFLLDRTWYLTLSGATIYSRKVREIMVSEGRKEEWRNFPQLGLILECCKQNTPLLYWYGKKSVEVNENKQKSYWTSKTFDVFVRDWSNLVRSFPELFSNSESDKVIRSHAIHTGVLGVKSLLNLRISRAFSVSVLSKYKNDFVIASPRYIIFSYMIALTPVVILVFLRKIFLMLRALKK